MELRFRDERPNFERLIAMSDEDPKVIRIAYDFTWVQGEKQSGEMGKDRAIGFSESRWVEYKNIFEQLKLEGGISRSENGKLLMLLADGRGLVPSSFAKGYMFTREGNDCTEPSLDNLEILSERKFACKRLDQNWSLYVAR